MICLINWSHNHYLDFLSDEYAVYYCSATRSFWTLHLISTGGAANFTKLLRDDAYALVEICRRIYYLENTIRKN